MSLDAATIANTLAALSISGVTVKDIDAVPLEPDSSDLPILTPDPDTWGGEASIVVGSFGGSEHYGECTRTLGYAYLHAEVGQGDSPVDHFADITANRDLILEAIFDCDLGDADIVSVNSGPITTIQWLTGKAYHGCLISVTVREMINP